MSYANLRPMILITAILLGLIAPPSARADELKTLIVGAQSARGQFIAALFDSPDTWLKTPVDTRIVQISKSGTALALFDIPPGSYGLAIYHDANSDGRINTGFLGMPTESFGFSNEATALLGPPGFDEARFDVPRGGTMISIRLDHIDEASD